MALLAEEIVEEWLNRNGYFTIRGLKLGVHEIDLLVLRVGGEGTIECRHIEVQASMRPVSYISRVPVTVQRTTGRAANSAKRSPEEIDVGVREWVDKKFRHPKKIAVMQSLCAVPWTSELVINNVKSEDEVARIQAHGVRILRLRDIVEDLSRPRAFTASGADLVDLIQMGQDTAGRK